GVLTAVNRTTISKEIKKTVVIKRKLIQGYSIIIEYSLLGTLENELRQSEHIIDNINYLQNVELIVYVDVNKTDSFLNWLTNLSSDHAIIKEYNQKYVELDVYNKTGIRYYILFQFC